MYQHVRGALAHIKHVSALMRAQRQGSIVNIGAGAAAKAGTAQAVTAETPSFRNIRIRNLTATSTRAAGVIIGLPESLVSNVVLENVQITSATTGLE